MAVNISWASNNSGSAISQPLSHGNVTNGNATTAQTIWVYHNGANSITNCAFYLAQYSGSYNGGASASADYSELLAWGDGAGASSFGGYWINADAADAFANSWPTLSNKTNTQGTAFAFRTGTGDLSGNAITTPAAMAGGGGGSAGTIPYHANGYGGDYKFQAKVSVPSDEDTAGKRQFDLVLKYTYTS
jgi:hypothetical protein